MLDRSQFTKGRGNPPVPVPLGDDITVPTEQMAILLVNLLDTRGSVLEIGTGSGFQTAVLAEYCKEVVSIEIQPTKDIAELLPENVTLMVGDGCSYDSGQEFDGVLVTFAAERIMHPWFKQVKEGGRLVVPLKMGNSCRICVYQKHKSQLHLVDIPAYAPFTEQRLAN